MSTGEWIALAVVLALAGLAAVLVLLVRVFRARKLLADAGIPLQNKALFWSAVVYTLSPVDLLPDPIYLDDIGFLMLALRSLHSGAHAVAARREKRTAPGRTSLTKDLQG
ncbi:YkvA family protein [Streptomyces albus]|nr:YkvA family protein [Streptomyces albus]